MKIIRTIFYTIIAVVIFYIAFNNMQIVSFTIVPEGIGFLPPMAFTVPLFAILIAGLICGVIIAYFLVFGRAFAAKRAKSKAESAQRKAEAELEKLKRKTGETDDDVLAILK